MQIERGHAEAVALARAATRTTTETIGGESVRNQEMNPIREDTPLNGMQGLIDGLTQEPHSTREGQQGWQTGTSVMEEGASFSTGNISSETNMTRQEGTEPPINGQTTREQQYKETPAHYTTGTPTETGTPEQPIASAMDRYLGDGLEDVLQNSQLLQGSFTALLEPENRIQENKPMPLAWVVPDTTNRTLEEIEE